MKFLIKGLAFASLLLCLTSAQATNLYPPVDGNFMMNLTQADDNTVVLYMANLQQETTAVELTDLEGNTYFTRYIKNHNGYSLKVDLEAVPQGRYILHVTQKDTQKTQVIYKGEDKLLISQVSIN